VTVFLSQANAIKTLETGVTTVRDLTGFDGADVAMRDLINMGAMVGPRMFVSGPGLRNTGSITDFAAIDGCTTSRSGAELTIVMGMKSFNGSYGILG
jgi:imidazolonepropionase-like amidohydrolase